MGRTDTLLGRVDSLAGAALAAIDRRFWPVTASLALALAAAQALLVYKAGAQLPTADGITYLLKARELVDGDWTPILSHEIGLPVLLAPLVALTAGWPLERQLPLLAAWDGLFGALSVLPVAWIARRWFGTTWILATAAWIAFQLRSLDLLTGLLTEPPFLLAAMLAFAFALDSDRWPRAAAAGACAGLSAWARPNGLFVIVILLVVAAVTTWTAAPPEARPKRVAASVGAMALGIAAFGGPKFAMRTAAFGAPTNYGPNSHYFVTDYGQVWNDNLPAVGLIGFLASTGPGRWIEQFVTGGAIPAVLAFLRLFGGSVVPYGLLLAIGLGIVVARGRPWPMILALAVWWAALSMVWRAFPFERHWWGVSPFAAMAVAVAIAALLEPQRQARAWIALAAAVILLDGARTARSDALDFAATGELAEVRPVAEGLLSEVSGKMAGNKSQWNVMLFEPTAKTGGQAQGWYRSDRLETLRLPYTDSVDEMMAYLRERDVTHLFVDGQRWDGSVRNTPALRSLFVDGDVARGETTVPCLEPVYDTFGQPGRWAVRVYRIDWDRCPRSG